MEKALIIVESPAKIKTLKKFLGSNFIFESSLGHVRDLPQKGFGIDVEHDFEPEYAIMPDKKEVIDNLKKLAKTVDVVYLSPDPDREGEAIAWHIASVFPKGTKYNDDGKSSGFAEMRTEGDENKCRAAKAKVISIYDLNGHRFVKSAKSSYSDQFGKHIDYVVGTMVYPNGFYDFSLVCAKGIHFFMTRKLAVAYHI